MTNEALREHTTSIGFSLTLSKRMIDHLVLLHHFKGDYNALKDGGFSQHPATWSWSQSMKALRERGLVSHRLVKDHQGYNVNAVFRPTKAGTLVINLLKEAGIYQDRLADLLGSVKKGVYKHKGMDHILSAKGLSA